jgi:sugar phosphate isomerase/epimerase
MRFAYGTNGFPDHCPTDILAVLADLGYDGVALALDHRHLASYADDPVTHVTAIVARLDELGLAVVIGTDPFHPVDPPCEPGSTLVGADGGGRRVDLLCRAVRFAAEIGSPVVSFRSGAGDGRAGLDVSWERLIAGCAAVLDEAAVHGVTLGFEPVAGAFVDSIEGYLELHRRLGGPEHLGLTLGVDVGGPVGAGLVPEGGAAVESPPARIRRLAPHLVDVRIADPGRPGRPQVAPTLGEVDPVPVLSALRDIGYAGLIGVDPPPGPATPETAGRSLRTLHHAAGRVPARR